MHVCIMSSQLFYFHSYIMHCQSDENMPFQTTLFKKRTYSVTISACSGSDHAISVGCIRILRAQYIHFLYDSPIPGGPKMVKFELAAQLTLPVF